MTIVRRLTQRWRPKLVCLLLATGLWYIIKQNVKQSPAPSLFRNPVEDVKPAPKPPVEEKPAPTPTPKPSKKHDRSS